MYGRAIGTNETGDVLAVGTSRNDIVCFDRREGTQSLLADVSHGNTVPNAAVS